MLHDLLCTILVHFSWAHRTRIGLLCSQWLSPCRSSATACLLFSRNVYRLTRLNQRDAHIDMLYKCEFAALLLTLSIAISLFRPLKCRPMRYEPKMMFDGIDVTMQCDCKICIRLLIWIRKVFCTTQTKNSNEPNRDRNTTQNTVFTDGNFFVCVAIVSRLVLELVGYSVALLKLI